MPRKRPTTADDVIFQIASLDAGQRQRLEDWLLTDPRSPVQWIIGAVHAELENRSAVPIDELTRIMEGLYRWGVLHGHLSRNARPRKGERDGTVALMLAEARAAGRGPDWGHILERLEQINPAWVKNGRGDTITPQALMNAYREWRKEHGEPT
jgi:hypothetical protein